MSFRPAAPKPKPAPLPKDERKKVTLRLTDRQWDQVRAHCYEKRITVQALLIRGLVDQLEVFDP